MKRFEHHAVAATQGSELLFSAFEDNGPMWSGQGPRLCTHPVRFSGRFVEPPLVHIGIGMADIDTSHNHRVDIRAVNVTTEGFDIEFRTWADSKVARIRAEWLAIGPVLYSDHWDT